MKEDITFADLLDLVGEVKVLLTYKTHGSIESAENVLDKLSENIQILSKTLKSELDDIKYLIRTELGG